MHSEEGSVQLTTKMLISRLLILVGVSVGVGVIGGETIFNSDQATACGFSLE